MTVSTVPVFMCLMVTSSQVRKRSSAGDDAGLLNPRMAALVASRLAETSSLLTKVMDTVQLRVKCDRLRSFSQAEAWARHNTILKEIPFRVELCRAQPLGWEKADRRSHYLTGNVI